MKSARVFKFFWRANAILIFAVGILGAIGLTAAFGHMVKREFRDRDVTAVVNTGDQQKMEEVLSLGSARRINGHPWLLVPLESNQKYHQSYYSKSAEAARNYAFVSPAEPVRWLYPHNRFLISDSSQLPGIAYGEEGESTVVISFEVVEKDSDNNGRLNLADTSALVFARPDGTGRTNVLEDAQLIISQQLVGEEILVIYKGSAGYASVVFSSKDFSRLRLEKLEFPVGKAPS